MATLTVRSEQSPIQEYRVRDGETLTIGRSKHNDVVIDNLGVSSHHAKIDAIEGKCLLADLKSKNGTLVNDALVSLHWLKHGDIISIGDHTLFFIYDEDEQEYSSEAENCEQTVLFDVGRHRPIHSKSEPNAGAQRSDEVAVGALSFLSEKRSDVRLTGKEFAIGKSASSDIVIKGLFVGRTAATIRKKPTGYYLTYVGGLARLKLNGQRVVKETIKLEDLDIIELASQKMQFRYKQSDT